MVNSTIQVSSELKKKLSDMKFSDHETFEDVIWDLLEDRMTLSKETLKDIEQAQKDIAAGKGIPLSEIKRKYHL